ncbi:aldose epimerase family protein [Aurantimonas sp. Leaf443]|uniref:aldose epimerase family protein n=1 Tax=Aurantimonas sp. Leaf443 TaxID=1736378 RepID=UPI0006F1E3FD|nr:aldose epimerase family protein [Aurantimonas sp. Leaf443]KQT85398.1 galactose mutarotase [Aurantimonas sp. Leaf443]
MSPRTPDRRIVGTIEGQPVEAFRLSGGETELEVIGFGAILTRLTRPDRHGVVEDIVLGYDDPADYVAMPGNAGAICGRHANRLAEGRFELDGRVIQLACNSGAHHLHGGARGFGKRFWSGHPDPSANAVEFRLESPDGDEGYPGALAASVTYSVLPGGAVSIVMRAEADRRTIVNLVHHGYWNLAGHASGNVLEQRLQIEADRYTPVTPDKIPTGEIVPVDGGPFDFRRAKAIGADIAKAWIDGGYDHNWCLNEPATGLRRCASALDARSGRRLELHSNQPGLQFYTANHYGLASARGKDGAIYEKFAGFALETQAYPNAPNCPGFPSVVLAAGEPYHHEMLIVFPDAGARESVREAVAPGAASGSIP